MIYKFLWICLLSLVLSACQTASKIERQNTSSDLVESSDDTDIVEADTEQLGFIDTVPPVDSSAEEVEDDKTTEPVIAISKPRPPKDIWERIRAGYQLNLDIDRPRLSSQLRWFSSHPSYLDRVSKRGERYLYYIVSELEKAGIPTEIALLPIVESGFDPFGYSHGRASGPWQFIPSTGQMYGLDQTWWYDGRR
ncbi:MAG: transglycosylase SLT domain-containing protein, partial [Oceanospirillaceae bacterium]|nr:transglycosylase SLT domain-containing protein [Oceanospirillaceae bacterium]